MKKKLTEAQLTARSEQAKAQLVYFLAHLPELTEEFEQFGVIGAKKKLANGYTVTFRIRQGR